MNNITIEEYLKNIPLFQGLNEQQYKLLCDESQIVKFKQESDIIYEGDLADCCYYLLSGSVQVYTLDKNQKKIVLARLDENNYFGEQGYVNNLIRTASIKALTDIILIKILYSTLDKIFAHSDKFRKYIEHISLKNFIANLQAEPSSISEYLKDIFLALHHEEFLSLNLKDKNITKQTWKFKIKNFFKRVLFRKKTLSAKSTFVKYYKQNQVIFYKNEPFDYVYLIASGSVRLEFDGGEKQTLVIGKNTMFGELGVLENKPRAATAKAHEFTALIAIPGKDFKKAVKNYKGLTSLTIALRNVYLLPANRGFVSQYQGIFQNQEAIFTIYTLENNTKVTCAKVVNQPIFTMTKEDAIADASYTFKQGKLIERTILLKGLQIVGIISIGEWDELSILCEMLLDDAKLHFFSKDDFTNTGNILNLSSNSQTYVDNDLICNCMHVTYETLKKEISTGFYELESLAAKTGVTSSCGGCTNRVLELLNKSSMMSAKIKFNKQYTNDICSFKIYPINKKFIEFTPGQYISIKLQINGHWIDRCYTLVSFCKNINNYEVIVKKHVNGSFTPWLFDHKDEVLFGWISYPSGKFILHNNIKRILCFAGGVGITPFFAFLRAIEKLDYKHTMQICYFVQNDSQVILPEDIKNFIDYNTNINLDIWNSDIKGLVDENSIHEVVHNTNPEYIYICGSKNFESAILKPLQKINFETKNIFTEEFTPAGG